MDKGGFRTVTAKGKTSCSALEAVVYCKDCKQSGIDSTSYPQYWCSAHAEYHDGNWFCADGERKEDDDDGEGILPASQKGGE